MATDPRDLGDGLRLRWSTPADIDRLVDGVGRAFGGSDGPPLALQDTVRRYMDPDYPFMGPEDFGLVEDTGRPDKPIVSCACYLRETWDFDGMPIPVARPEIVGTDPAYRRKGLVRALFGLLHERSATDDTLVQGITGIPYFYRQFGYEYALDLGGGIRLPAALLPTSPADEPEPYHLRPAVERDLHRIAACYRRQHDGYLVSHRLPDSFWRYHLAAEQEDALRNYLRLRVFEKRGGEFRGFVALPYDRESESWGPFLVAFEDGLDLQEIAPSLVRELRRIADEVPATKPDTPLRTLHLTLGRDHPLASVLPKSWAPQVDQPYAWYLRIPDVPAFLRRIAPVLEARLAESPFAGRTGELRLDLFRDRLRLAFDDGRLKAVEMYGAAQGGSTPDEAAAKGRIPPLVLTQLLAGYRSLTELRAIYPDVWAHDDVAPLLEALFPKRPSSVFAV